MSSEIFMLIKKFCLIISIALYLIALTQKCYCTDNGHCGDTIAVVLTGWLGLMMGGAMITWLANPLIWGSWLFSTNGKVSLALSLLALVFSLSFLLFTEIVSDGSGHPRAIIGYRSGYWLWVFSILICFLGNFISFIGTKYFIAP